MEGVHLVRFYVLLTVRAVETILTSTWGGRDNNTHNAEKSVKMCIYFIPIIQEIWMADENVQSEI